MRSIRIGGLRLSFTAAWLLPVILSAVVLVVVSAAAIAAIETRTVGSFPRGLWWALSLITTVGFIGEPPETIAGALLSAVLMVVGFFLLAMVSASLAALFVREEEEEPTAELEAIGREILERLEQLDRRLAELQSAAAPPEEEPRDAEQA
ncbi:MAG TPA: potassium channel family protein [Nocardioides sp.]|nr:potassium channel family protein [Nocardioides sp.]